MTDLLIIGAGLSGLAVADHAQRTSRDFMLLEARDRCGGRIFAKQFEDVSFDMGPAWFWPGQPRMASALQRFGLSWFDQHSAGHVTFEDETGRVMRDQGFASMQGSLRVAGGLQGLIDAFVKALPSERLRCNARVTQLDRTPDGVRASLSNGDVVQARHVILAGPLRVFAQNIAFVPALDPHILDKMDSTATWMAGQAKAIAVYDTPFWRADGLSGDAMSRRGPMVEMHDASPQTGPYGALFGWLGIPPAARQNEDAVRAGVVAQLSRIFGPRAGTPRTVYIKDWAKDPLTATVLDQTPIHAHPHYGLPDALRDIWDDALIFAGTEVGAQFGGFLEGALEAAEAAAARLDLIATPI